MTTDPWPAATQAWVRRFAPRPNAARRLICFPYAGGSASVFRKWAFALPNDIEVCAIDYPGRGSRLREPRFTHLDDLVRNAAHALNPVLDRPFAVVGYSLGALIAFEWLRHRSPALDQPAPDHLVVISCRAPHLLAVDEPLHTLNDAQLVDAVQTRYDGIPAAILREPEWLAMLLPVLRDDLQVVETYRCQPGPLLACPVHVHGGDADPTLTPQALRAWETQTAASCSMQTWRGGHFFVADHEAAWLRALLDAWTHHAAPHT